MTYPISEAKCRLPLPQLLAKIGDAEHGKKSSRCPFHEDTNNSFSVFQVSDSNWLWKCFAGCGTGDGVEYLKKRFRLSTGEAICRYCVEAGLKVRHSAQPKAPTFNWQSCVAAFNGEHQRKLAEWRGYSLEFVKWLHSRGLVGLRDSHIAFPVQDGEGKIVGCHCCNQEEHSWWYAPKGTKTRPLLLPAERTSRVYVFESQWDAFSLMDKQGWYAAEGPADTTVVITRGSENGKLVAGHCPARTLAYLFAQNDKAGEKWLSDVASCLSCKTSRVVTPAAHKDLNDWARAGAAKSDIEKAICEASVIQMAQPRAVEVASELGFEKLTVWVRGEIIKLLQDRFVPATTKRAKISEKVVAALMRLGGFYYHADLQNFESAMYFDSYRKRLERVRADSFCAWLSEWTRINRAEPCFRFITAAIETAALSGERTTKVVPEAFWAVRPGAIFREDQ